MTYVLPNPLPLLPGENFGSVIIRNVRAFKLDNPMHLFARIDLPFRTVGSLVHADLHNPAGDRIRRLLGIGEADFERIVRGTSNGAVENLLGHQVRSRLMVRHRRFCPECFKAEIPYHRAVWDCMAVAVCPDHCVLLHDHCPRCKGKLGWNHSDLTSCHRCQLDLRAAETTRVPEEELAATRDLIARLEGGADESYPVEGVDFSGWTTLMMSLGAISLGASTGDFFRRTPSVARVHQITNVGHRFLSHWPTSLDPLLESLRKGAGSREKRFGLKKEFGPFLTWLGKNKAASFHDTAFGAFSDFISRQTDLTVARRVLRKYAPAHPSLQLYVLQNEAADSLGVSSPRMNEIAERYDLYFVPPTGQGAEALIRLDRLKAVREKMRRQWNQEQTYEFLRISKHGFQAFRTTGLLSEIAVEDRVVEESSYAAEEVAGFVAKLEAKVVPMKRRRLVKISSLARMGKTIGDVCAAVLAGDLIPRGIDVKAKGLDRLRFDSDEFVEAFAKDGETFSVSEAAEKMGVCAKVVDRWVKSGLIETVRGRVMIERGRRITQGTIDRFQATYITGPEFSRKVDGRSSRSGSMHLMKTGVTPVSGPSVDGNSQYLFRRSDIEAATVKALRSVVAGTKQGRAKRRGFVVDYAKTIGSRAADILGWNVTVRLNCYSGKPGDTFFVLTGRRDGILGSYSFTMSALAARSLDRSERGIVVLALFGQPFFLMIPWQRLAGKFQRLQTGQKVSFRIVVDWDGNTGAFEEFKHPT